MGVVASASAPGSPGWMIPVFSSTKAMDEITFLLGSQALYPHTSSLSKPLYGELATGYRHPRAHLMHSMSIRCCSAILFSLLTFLCKAAKIVFLSASAFPQLFFNSLSSSLGIPVLISVLAISPGLVMEKYSSSSRRTMMACLVTRGLAD